MFLFPRDVSGNTLVAFFLLTHVVLAAQMWCRPRIVTGVLSGVALGLLVLTEGLFQYWLVGVAGVLVAGWWGDVVRRCSLLAPCAGLLIVALGLSLPWMIRNQVELERFGITGRDGEVLAIRAEYGRMTWSEVRGAFAYYLPAKGVLRAKAMRWLEPATYGYSRFPNNAPEGFHMRARTYEGDVAARADLLTPGWRQPEDYRVGRWEIRNRVAQDLALKRAALSLIREDWLKHLVLTVAFAERGSYFGCRDYSSAAEKYGTGANLPLRLGCYLSRGLSLLFLPAVGLLLLLSWKRRRFELVFLTLPVVWIFGILSLAAHFLPRYSSPLVPVLTVGLALVAKEAWLWARARQWRPRC